jgi:hypothetical protein
VSRTTLGVGVLRAQVAGRLVILVGEGTGPARFTEVSVGAELVTSLASLGWIRRRVGRRVRAIRSALR